MSNFDPTTAPAAGEEPMLLLDITGSMSWPAAAASPVSRRSVLQEAMSIVVARLAAENSEAAHEADGGGLRTVTFADGHAKDIGDLNPGNLRKKWESIT